jgi:hypothetical protein
MLSRLELIQFPKKPLFKLMARISITREEDTAVVVAEVAGAEVEEETLETIKTTTGILTGVRRVISTRITRGIRTGPLKRATIEPLNREEDSSNSSNLEGEVQEDLLPGVRLDVDVEQAEVPQEEVCTLFFLSIFPSF